MFRNVYNNKKVLVTGNTGFKGSWLTIWLKILGAEVVGLSDSIPTEPSNYKISDLEKKIEQNFVNIINYNAVSDIVDKYQPDIIFHLAAQSLVRESISAPHQTFQTNTMGTANILEALRQNDKSIPTVIITSDKCYRNVEWVWGYRENDELGGDDPYSGSKAAAELVFRSYVNTFDNIIATTTRAGNVIGGGDWAPDRIIPDCITAWLNGKLPLIRKPKATRPWQHVLEPLSGYLTLGSLLYSEPQKYKGQSYNFGPTSDFSYTVLSLLKIMKEYWPDINWEESQSKKDSEAESTLLSLNCEKALSNLSWKSLMNINETVRMTAEWYLAYNDGADMYQFSKNQILNYVELGRKQKIDWANEK